MKGLGKKFREVMGVGLVSLTSLAGFGCYTPFDPLAACPDPEDQVYRWVLTEQFPPLEGQVCEALYLPGGLPIPVGYWCLSWPIVPDSVEIPSPSSYPDSYSKVTACKDTPLRATPGLPELNGEVEFTKIFIPVETTGADF